MSRHVSYNLDFVLDLSRAGFSAEAIVRKLNLRVGERAIQKQVAKHLGRRPTKKTVEAYDPVRSRVVAYMVAQGLDERYCMYCEKRTLYKCAIRELRRSDSLDDLVFVCRHCATVADA